jgi:gluconolactonase
VTHIEYDGTCTVLASYYQGKRLNSPNDVIISIDGAIWFSDPSYDIDSNYEGIRAESEIGASHL